MEASTRIGNAVENITNPLFFEFFPAVSKDNYVEYLLAQFEDLKQIRKIFIRDIYQAETVLRKKYRFLRFAYILFSTGVLSSGAATI